MNNNNEGGGREERCPRCRIRLVDGGGCFSLEGEDKREQSRNVALGNVFT